METESYNSLGGCEKWNFLKQQIRAVIFAGVFSIYRAEQIDIQNCLLGKSKCIR